MTGRWRLAFFIGVPLVLILAFAAIFLLPRLTAPSPSPLITPTATTTHLPTAVVSRLEKALSDPDMHVQATVMIPELASSYLANGQPSYPAGSTVKVLQDTSVCKGDVCVIRATVTEPGGKQTSFLLYLSNVSGTWLIVDTAKES